jgi:copper(I)-binding protein
MGLTGSEEEIARAARAYGVYYVKVAAEDGDPSRYTMDHTSRSYLVGPDGNGIASFSHSSSAEEIAAEITAILGRAPRVVVDRPWSRATAGLAHAGVVYLTLRNEGREPDRLISVETPAAGDASIHETRMQGDRMSMRHLDALDLPSRRDVALEPGGLHIMLMELGAPLEAGGSFPLVLGFERAGRVEVEVQVQAADAMAPGANAD